MHAVLRRIRKITAVPRRKNFGAARLTLFFITLIGIAKRTTFTLILIFFLSAYEINSGSRYPKDKESDDQNADPPHKLPIQTDIRSGRSQR